MMLEKKSFEYFCNRNRPRQIRLRIAGMILLPVFLQLLFSGFDPVRAQNDSVPGAGIGNITIRDSDDYYLSTDTNRHDISVPLNSGYVVQEQDLRHIPPSRIRSYKSREEFAYANDPAYWQSEKPKDLHLEIYWRLFEIVCGAFLIYGIYRLGKENFSGLFSRKVSKPQTGNPETGEELLTSDDLDKRLAAAIGAGDFRGAVRFQYLKLLKGLQDRQLIPVGRLSTNRAWASVFTDPLQARQFRALSNAYEYVVYGGFELNETQFGELQQQFSEFSKNLAG